MPYSSGWLLLAAFAARPHFREQNMAVSEEAKGHLHINHFCSAAANGGIALNVEIQARE